MTDASGGPILVAGATGRQGGSVVRHLLERQLTVRALVRDPKCDRAKALAGQGIEIAQGDMQQVGGIASAFYLMKGPPGNDASGCQVPWSQSFRL